MQTVSLTWEHSWEVSAAVTLVGAAMARSSRPRVRAVGAFCREAAMIGFLYGLWQLAGMVANGGTAGAFARAHWIRHFETAWLPSIPWIQHLVLPHPLLVQGLNWYYAAMHFPMTFTFLIWLFWRHRDHYKPVRRVLAVTTLFCLLVQLLPVAPPRMLPGIVDTGMKYGESVYAGGLAADQLSAMPSVHVAWAVFVGFYVWRISSSRWRWIGPAHSVITVFVVLSTGNHWWLDGFVAVALLVVSAWAVRGVEAAVRWWLARRRAGTAPPGAPLDEGVAVG